VIVYRNFSPGDNAWRVFASVRNQVSQPLDSFDIDAVHSLLIDVGEIETAVVDQRNPLHDDFDFVAAEYRLASIAAARMLVHAWRQQPVELERWLQIARARIAALDRMPPPKSILTRVPEGYCYHALFPETYLTAAEQFFATYHPSRVTCIGLRSIGTSLSAVVAATLEAHCCDTRSFTFRPHGHPFDRRVSLAARLRDELRSRADSFFVVIDEGPGRSGSSFAAAVDALSEIGIADDKIILMPSWTPDASQLNSERARACWKRHEKFCGDFDAAWLNSGRLFGAARFADWSAGRWRNDVYGSEDEFAAVYPQHERRKYLFPNDGDQRIVKFAGLGRYGQAKLERARHLQNLGFGQGIVDESSLQHGFIISNRIAGQPCTAQDCTPLLLESMAHYTASLAREFPTGETTDESELWQMMEINIGEGLGTAWLNALSGLSKLRHIVEDASTTQIDGRLLPHEWLRNGASFIKLDTLDHYNDNFFPGCQNIGWDLAGAIEEFDLAPASADFLIQRYIACSHDHCIELRLPYYRAAYLAYRLGYVELAQTCVQCNSERQRFSVLASSYRRQLQAALLQAAHACV
jgi:hypothetical protein